MKRRNRKSVKSQEHDVPWPPRLLAPDLGIRSRSGSGRKGTDFISPCFRRMTPLRHHLTAELTALRAVPLSSQGAPGASSRLSSTLGCMSCLLLLLELGCRCWGYLCEVHTAQLNVSARCQCSAEHRTAAPQCRANLGLVVLLGAPAAMCCPRCSIR